MEVTAQKQPVAILHQHCQFPTAIRRDVKNIKYRTFPIFDRENAVVARKQDSKPLRPLILNVWAILLRYYVRNDVVVFLLFSASLGHCCIGSIETKSCCGDETEAALLQYELSDNLLLREIRASESTRYTYQETENVRASTAVGHGMPSLSRRAENDVAMDNVRHMITLYHRDFVPKIKLQHSVM